MKTNRDGLSPYRAQIAFLPAITPMEAAVLPAELPARYGVLGMIPRAAEAFAGGENQRAKIWVR